MQSLFPKIALALSLSAALGGVSPAVQAAPAQTPSQTHRAGRAAIVAAYAKQSQAFKRQDVAALMGLYTPDFQDYDESGAVRNYAESEALLLRSFGLVDRLNGALGVSTRFTKYAPKILSLSWRGKDAIVMCQTTAVSISTKAGRSARTEMVVVARDYWTPTAQGWKIRQSATRQTKAWLNGERMR